ncbi:MAG: hypothetical protein F6K19_30865 [Cyanothece sp. SIO1E1]|nr:hypothetical protein [Cyanothece sp. SIO1E1]
MALSKGLANNLAWHFQQEITSNSGKDPKGSITKQKYDKKLKKYVVEMKLEWKGYPTHLDWMQGNLETFVLKVKALVNKDETIDEHEIISKNSAITKTERANLLLSIAKIARRILGDFTFEGAADEFPSK